MDLAKVQKKKHQKITEETTRLNIAKLKKSQKKIIFKEKQKGEMDFKTPVRSAK